MRGCLVTLSVALTVVAAAAAQDGAKEKPAPHDKKEQPVQTDTRPKALIPEFHEGTDARCLHMNEISKEGKARLVFLGDSITEGWETSGKEAWKKYFEPYEAANFGISGDRTEHVLWRLEHGNLDGLKPRLVVILIGTNNTGHRQDKSEDTAAGVKAIVEQVRKKCPESKILLLAIFPRSEKPDDPPRKLNDGANAIIKRLADDKTIFYKDIGAVFLEKDGTLKRDLMPDWLHPNRKGYEAWAEAIKDDVAKLMKE